MATSSDKLKDFIIISFVFLLGFNVFFFVIGFQGSYILILPNHYHDDGSHVLYDTTKYCLPGDKVWVPVYGRALQGYHDIEINKIKVNDEEAEIAGSSGENHLLFKSDKLYADKNGKFSSSDSVGKIAFYVPTNDKLLLTYPKVFFDIWFYTPIPDFENHTFSMKKFRLVNSTILKIGSAKQYSIISNWDFVLAIVYIVFTILIIIMSYKIIYKKT